jgi:hypothetical protein
MSDFFVGPRHLRNGDGTSRDKAWAGFENIDRSKVEDRDPIVIFGEHRPRGDRMEGLPVWRSGLTYRTALDDRAILIGHYCEIEGFDKVKLRGLTFIDHGQIVIRKARKIDINYCSFDKLDPDAIIAVELQAGAHDCRIRNSSFWRCGNAIYSRIRNDPAADAPRGLRVDKCTFRRIGRGRWISKDGHAIGVQAGGKFKFRYNSISD